MRTINGAVEDLGSPGSGSLSSVVISEREFELFRELIYQQTGISLHETKKSMLSARLGKRLRQLNLPSFEAYYDFLHESPSDSEEYRLLINSVTTNKTAFFREMHHFKFLGEQLRLHKPTGPLRIWSSACSTGQEPYSIAMTVADALSPLQGKDIRILASDIDTQVLHEASEGLYDPDLLEDVSPINRSRFLNVEQTAHGIKFRVARELRDLITFRQKNLIAQSWAINTRFDFIFCRNVLIYFDRETQDQILRKFISFLKPNGYLIVGHSEHLNWLSSLIEPVGKTIYRLRASGIKQK